MSSCEETPGCEWCLASPRDIGARSDLKAVCILCGWFAKNDETTVLAWLF